LRRDARRDDVYDLRNTPAFAAYWNGVVVLLRKDAYRNHVVATDADRWRVPPGWGGPVAGMNGLTGEAGGFRGLPGAAGSVVRPGVAESDGPFAPGRRRWMVCGASRPAGEVTSAGWASGGGQLGTGAFAHLSFAPADTEVPEVQILAVADGAPEAPRSADGARLAASIALTQAGGYLRRHGVRATVGALVGGGSIDAYAASLTVVFLFHPVVASFAVGDGFVAIQTHPGEVAAPCLLDAALAGATAPVYLTSGAAAGGENGTGRTAVAVEPVASGVLVAGSLLARAALRPVGPGFALADDNRALREIMTVSDDREVDLGALARLAGPAAAAGGAAAATVLVAVPRPAAARA
jgi:hypothetical protein